MDKLLCAVPDVYHALDAFQHGVFHVHGLHHGIFTVINTAVHHAEAVIFHVWVCRDCLVCRFTFQLIKLRFLYLPVNAAYGF